MKILLSILLMPFCCFAQSNPEIRSSVKLNYKARVISDSGTIKGYYVSNSDSAVILSTQKRYMNNSTISIPVNTIRELKLKPKTGNNLLAVTAGTVLGFTLAAGLTKNGGDVNDDGKTSFWELLFTAIEGTTSSNRKRRNTALIVGGLGGTVSMLAILFTDKKFTLTFPLSNRNNFYSEKKGELNKYIKF